jgi:AcrR family transcriptional regulator
MEQVRKVIDTAWSMFRRFGVRSVSMDDVAREMSISKKTLYRCFRDKNELISRTLEHDITGIEEKVDEIISSEANPVKQVIQIAQYVAEYLKQVNPSMIYDLQKYHPEIYSEFSRYREKTFLDRVKKNLRNGILQGYYRNSIDPETTSRLYLCLMTHGPEHLGNVGEFSDYQELYLNIMRYHLHAIATPKGLKEAQDFLHEPNSI